MTGFEFQVKIPTQNQSLKTQNTEGSLFNASHYFEKKFGNKIDLQATSGKGFDLFRRCFF